MPRAGTQLQLVLLDVGEDFSREVCRAGGVVDPRHSPILVYEDGDASRLFRGARVGRSVGDRDRHLCVAQQRKIKVVAACKLQVCVDRVVRAARDGNVVRRKLGAQALERPPLCGSPASAGARVEPQHQLFTSVVAERDRGTRVRGGGEIGRRVADSEHGVPRAKRA